MSPSVPVQYSHLTGPLVGAKREKFDLYWFIGPLCILRQVLTFDLTNKMLMHVTKNVVQVVNSLLVSYFVTYQPMRDVGRACFQ